MKHTLLSLLTIFISLSAFADDDDAILRKRNGGTGHGLPPSEIIYCTYEDGELTFTYDESAIGVIEVTVVDSSYHIVLSNVHTTSEMPVYVRLVPGVYEVSAFTSTDGEEYYGILNISSND